MASTSGTKAVVHSVPRLPSRRLTRLPTRNMELLDEEGATDSEIVPSSLAVIVPILRAANEIEQENPRVAYLCRFHAFEKAHTMDPTSSGRGVRQFKTFLLHRLQREGEDTKQSTKRSDTRELQSYYQTFYEQHVRGGEFTKKPEEMDKILQIATVLYDVLKAMVSPKDIENKTREYAMDVEKKRGQCENYNILPLYAVGVKPAIMEVPEIQAALNVLRKVENLPMPIIHSRNDSSSGASRMPVERFKEINDILDWLSSVFGFQKGNVANQREHLVLLLANIYIRNTKPESHELHENTLPHLLEKMFKNYYSWCNHVRCKSNISFPEDGDKQQLELIYIALYLLIWGEASNIRFMPECLCYIFHHMCGHVYEILQSNVHPVSGEKDKVEAPDEETFLRDVITPIYNVLEQEAQRNNQGKASHSKWRNYDDLNEYFWSDKCFKLGWPMDPEADFFRNSAESQPANEVSFMPFSLSSLSQGLWF